MARGKPLPGEKENNTWDATDSCKMMSNTQTERRGDAAETCIRLPLLPTGWASPMPLPLTLVRSRMSPGAGWDGAAVAQEGGGRLAPLGTGHSCQPRLAQGLLAGQVLGGKRLVQLHQVIIRNGGAALAQEVGHRRDGAVPHDLRGTPAGGHPCSASRW